MERTTTFLIIAGSFVLAFIMGPMQQLLTGKIELKKPHYQEAKTIFRSGDPQRFYSRIAFEILLLIVTTVVVYLIMF